MLRLIPNSTSSSLEKNLLLLNDKNVQFRLCLKWSWTQSNQWIPRDLLTLKCKLSQAWYGKKKSKHSATTKRQEFGKSKQSMVPENPQSLMMNTCSSWCWNKFANNAAAFQQWEFQSQTVFSSILYTFYAVNELGMSLKVDDLISLKQVLK